MISKIFDADKVNVDFSSDDVISPVDVVAAVDIDDAVVGEASAVVGDVGTDVVKIDFSDGVVSPVDVVAAVDVDTAVVIVAVVVAAVEDTQSFISPENK